MFSEETTKVLQHFGTFAESMIMYPGKPLAAMRPSQALSALARVDFNPPNAPEEGIGVNDIKSLHSKIKMFDSFGGKTDIQVLEDAIQFTSADGKFQQKIFKSDIDVLSSSVPKPEKLQPYIDAPGIVEFELDSEDLKKFMQGAAANGTNTIGIQNDNGHIKLYAADFNSAGDEERTSSRFELELGVGPSTDFNVAIQSDNFIILNGDYTVKVQNNILVFKGEYVDYILYLLDWSTVDGD